MKEKSQNTIAVRTRKWIINALLELMNEKYFTEITIKEINIRADIARQTFYRHFQSKEEVLEEYIHQLYEEYNKIINDLEEKTLYSISLTYFIYWKKQSDFLNLLKKSKCEYSVFENYNVIMNKSLDVIRSQFSNQDEEEFQYTKAFLIGGFFNLKYLWMNNNYLKSPEELAKLINNSLLNFSAGKGINETNSRFN